MLRRGPHFRLFYAFIQTLHVRARTPRDANLISANPICFTMNEQRGMAERPEAEYHPDQGHERDGKSGCWVLCWQYWAVVLGYFGFGNGESAKTKPPP